MLTSNLRILHVCFCPHPIKVDGVADGPTEVAPKDIIYDGALNERLVYWHNVTLDLKGRKAWFVFDPKPEK